MSQKIFSCAVLCIVTGLATAAYARPLNPNLVPQKFDCGDHWFGVEVEWRDDVPVVRLTGDSLTNSLEYQAVAAAVRDADTGITTYRFLFGDGDRGDQSLTVTVQGAAWRGEGVYRSAADQEPWDMVCHLY